MAQKRVHILSAVNASAVSYADGRFTIKGVCGAVNDIVMNGMLYPADQLAKGVVTLNGRPAPAGHPKNSKGQYISALNGEALLNAYMGSICTNARHEGGKTLTDIVVNEAQAKAHPDGAKLVERLHAVIAGNSADPIHVSTGLFVEPITANGESLGKKYDRIATNLQYDHLAILLNEQGAGTPAQGVGMFLNAEGGEEEVEAVTVNVDPEDRRGEGLLARANALIRRLLGNGSAEVSFDQISSGLYALLPEGAWLRDVFDRYAIWTDRDGKYFRQDYSVSSDGSVAFLGNPVEVARRVEYQPVTNREDDPVKEQILAALNAAGIKTDGMSDVQLLSAYNSLVTKPVTDQLTAANAKIAEHELAANAAKEAELTALATELAANTSLTPEDFKAMGLERCKAIKANAAAAGKTAAPVVPAAGKKEGESEFKGYSLNAHFDEEKK
jgi:hypothetical protein